MTISELHFRLNDYSAVQDAERTVPFRHQLLRGRLKGCRKKAPLKEQLTKNFMMCCSDEIKIEIPDCVYYFLNIVKELLML